MGAGIPRTENELVRKKMPRPPPPRHKQSCSPQKRYFGQMLVNFEQIFLFQQNGGVKQ